MNRQWLRLLCAGALTFTSLLAHAQYSWIDAKGMRVFSDRPPPPGTPPSRIMKTPRGLEPAPAPAKTAAPTLAEREADYRKRTAQHETDEKKAAAEKAAGKARDESCAATREYERTLASGMRLTRVNAQGEQETLTDEDRAREKERVQRVLAGCG